MTPARTGAPTKPMISVPGVAEFLLWTVLTLLFSLFVAGGSWIFAGLIIGGLALYVAAIYSFKILLMAWMIGMPTVFAFGNSLIRSASMPIITIERLLFGILFLSLVTSILLRRLEPPPLMRIEKCMSLFLVVACLSFLSTTSGKSLGALQKDVVLLIQGFVMPFCGFYLARNQDWEDEGLRKFLLLFTLVGIYLAVAGLLQYFFKVTHFVPAYLIVNHSFDRASGSFGSPLEYGQVMSAIFVITLLQFARSRDRLRRALFLGAMLLILAGVIISKTRATWLGLFVALILMCRHDRRVRRTLVAGLAIGTVILLAALPFLRESRSFRERVTEVSPIYNRIALLSTTVNMIAHNPVFGIGFGLTSFKEAKPEYVISVGPATIERYALFPGVPHNEFLHIFVLTGIVGFIPYILVYYYAYGILREGGIRPPEESSIRAELSTYMKAVFAILVINAMFADMIMFPYFLSFFYFLLGILASPESRDPRDAGGTVGEATFRSHLPVAGRMSSGRRP